MECVKKMMIGCCFIFFMMGTASADDKLFCCRDSNDQQQMLEDFNTPSNKVDFSFPAGSFRKVCTHCTYDLKNLSCYCEDNTARTSNFPSYLMAANHCPHIYDNEDGFLKCSE